MQLESMKRCGRQNEKEIKIIYSVKTLICADEITYAEDRKMFDTSQCSVSAPVTLNLCILFNQSVYTLRLIIKYSDLTYFHTESYGVCLCFLS
jgi:hypothetical protein